MVGQCQNMAMNFSEGNVSSGELMESQDSTILMRHIIKEEKDIEVEKLHIHIQLDNLIRSENREFLAIKLKTENNSTFDEEIDQSDVFLQAPYNYTIKDVDKIDNGQTYAETTKTEITDKKLQKLEDLNFLKNATSVLDDYEEDLMEPFTGFTGLDQQRIFTLLERKSDQIFDLVQSLDKNSEDTDITSILTHKEPITIPRKLYFVQGGGNIKLQIKNQGQRKEDSSMATEFDMLLQPLDCGWKREIVLESEASPTGKDVHVYYYPPKNGQTIRSMEDLFQYLAENPSSGFTVDNFSFADNKVCKYHENEFLNRDFGNKLAQGKEEITIEQSCSAPEIPVSEEVIEKTTIEVTKEMNTTYKKSKKGAESKSALSLLTEADSTTESTDETRNDDEMVMGMVPLNYPKGTEIYWGSHLPKPTQKRKRGRPRGSKKFSLTKDKGLKDVGIFNKDLETNRETLKISSLLPLESVEQQSISADDGKSTDGGGSFDFISCSTECEDMQGQVPKLLCNMCLRFYHPECLGLPLNLTFTTYMCSNCVEPNQ